MANEYEIFEFLEADNADKNSSRKLQRRRLRGECDPFNTDDKEFIKRYRLTKELAHNLCEELRPMMKGPSKSTDLSVETKVLTALSFYANGSYQLPIGCIEGHSMAQQTVSSVIAQVTACLNSQEMRQKYIHFPTNDQERNSIKAGFYSKFKIPGVLGCIDCTHVAIVRPTQHEERFYCRKHYHSLNVQLVCDSNMQILSVDASHGGATHDSFIWNHHPLKAHLEDLSNTENIWFLGTTFGQQQTTQPTSVISFGTTTSTAAASQPSLNFGATPTSKPVSQPAGGISFAPTSQVTAALSFGVPGTTGASQAGTLSTIASAQPGSTFGAATTGISFAPGSTSSQSTGFSFAKPTSTSTVSGILATSGVTSFSLAKPTASTMASLITTTTTTTAAPPQQISSISFAELEENINKWTLDLEEQEKTFINQATQINAWDRLLIANGEKVGIQIVELNESVQTVKNEQQSLEHELDFVLAQQKELEDLLAPMEKQMMENNADRIRDPEREHMYTLAENLDTQLKQMSEDLKEVIEHLNETNMGQDSNDPIVQIGRILNTHMSSMQWIDNSIAQISNKLDQLKATHDKLRRDNERSFQLTYN